MAVLDSFAFKDSQVELYSVAYTQIIKNIMHEEFYYYVTNVINLRKKQVKNSRLGCFFRSLRLCVTE